MKDLLLNKLINCDVFSSRDFDNEIYFEFYLNSYEESCLLIQIGDSVKIFKHVSLFGVKLKAVIDMAIDYILCEIEKDK